jgi:hypothetical protein
MPDDGRRTTDGSIKWGGGYGKVARETLPSTTMSSRWEAEGKRKL